MKFKFSRKLSFLIGQPGLKLKHGDGAQSQSGVRMLNLSFLCHTMSELLFLMKPMLQIWLWILPNLTWMMVWDM